MSRPDAYQSVTGRVRATLPVKIAVIIFWLSTIVGGVVSAVMLHDAEQNIIDRQAGSSERFLYHLNREQEGDPVESMATILTRLDALRVELGIVAVEVDTLNGGRLIQSGDKAPNMMASKHELISHADGKEYAYQHSHVFLYFSDLKTSIAAERKRFFVVLGVGLLILGAVLAWVLRLVLARPFDHMITTAQNLLAGDSRARFDDRRKDEFGFLARFVNKVMDSLLAKQQELGSALERVRASEVALFEEKERAEVTLRSIGDGVVSTDAEGIVEYLNPTAERLLGLPPGRVLGQKIDEVLRFVDEIQRAPLANPVMQCLRQDKAMMVDETVLLIRSDGEEIPVTHSVAPRRASNGALDGAVIVFHDIGHTRNLARQLSYQASHDGLTGLFNRVEFDTRLRQALHEARSDNKAHALCYLDLDQFKLVNDTCGHKAGDELLQQLSVMLQKQVRDSDVLARLGGDEFGVLLKYCHMQHAQKVANTLREKIKEFRFKWDGYSFELSASIGLAPITGETQSITEVLSAADVACFAAKDGGRNRVHVYQRDDEELKQRRGEMQWVPQIRKALEENRFQLYFQTIVPVDTASPPIKRFEILVRMLDEQGALVPPNFFIPAAERYDLMPEVDRWVVRHTLRALQDQPTLQGKWTCCINLSGQSLSDPKFLDFILTELNESEVDPEHICFEITETAAVANLRLAMRLIAVLRGTGCRFALDDFGSGLSSFAYLKSLKVDYLKIDGSFIKDMTYDPMHSAMVEAINRIGHVLGLQTIAEFVENDEILMALRELGVDYAQGYGIARPQPLDTLLEMGGTLSAGR